MDELLVDGGTIEFVPGSGWSWAGRWDGKLVLDAAANGMTAEAKNVALAVDLEQLQAKLLAKSYTASGFDDVLGTVSAAKVNVDVNTLSPCVTIGGARSGTAHTSGKFQIMCVPSFKAGSPPIPDPAPVKNGTWRVAQSGQSAARAAR